MVVTSLLDALGVASIMPFIAILTNPSIITENIYLSKIYSFVGATDLKTFLFGLGFSIFFLMSITLSLKAICLYCMIKFVRMLEHSLSTKLITSYLRQDYFWFLTKHSGDLSKSVISEVSQVTGNGIMPVMQMISSGSVILAMTTLTLIADPFLAFNIAAGLALIYLILYFTVNKKLIQIGEERLKFNELRFKTLSEVFGGIKEVKVSGLEDIYIQKYKHPSKLFANIDALAPVIAQLPRFLLEMVAFGSLLLVTLFFLSKENGISSVLPLISLFAFAGYRLMPAMQQFYSYSTMLRYAGPSIDSLCDDLAMGYENLDQTFSKPSLKFNKDIQLKNICFSYNSSSRRTLSNINLEIIKNSLVGFVGPTGSGKTTIVDIILRLLKPDSGTFLIDGEPVDDTYNKSWQKLVGYVPQNIFLTDDTITANIALGCSPDEINFDKVREAAKTANIDEFILNELPLGYETFVGERGIRISGGQRQRIGIARSLYNSPKLLIFDEATSALDNLTEKAVMKSLRSIQNETTIILIAHRLSTVESCDNIYFFNNGHIEANGRFDQLLKTSKTFREMVVNPN